MVLYALYISDKSGVKGVTVSPSISPSKPVTVADLSGLGLGGGGGDSGVSGGGGGGWLRSYFDTGSNDPFDTPFFRGELDWQQIPRYTEGKASVIDVSQLT